MSAILGLEANMTTARDRFVQTMNHQTAMPPFVRASGAWQETLSLWREQGWDGRPMHEIFGTDVLLRVDPYYGPAPAFAYQVLAEDEVTRTYVNHEGILMREFIAHRDASMPQFIRFPVQSEVDFDQFAGERLALNHQARFTADWQARVSDAQRSDEPRQCWADRWGGYFGPLRNMMGLENLCLAFYDQPKLVERMMEQRTEAIITITTEVLRHTTFETFWFWEDMAHNGGSLIDPRLFRRFALPHYRRVCDWLRTQGIQHVWLDSDGDISELIPLWLEAGLTGLWPFEVNAGMDVLEVRRTYGHALGIGGGIGKYALVQGDSAMRKAVERVMPLVEDGGYFPELDHSAPPDISWSSFCRYMEYLLYRLGRG
jgi:hypothetical protein